jgi:hypothetical protein
METSHTAAMCTLSSVYNLHATAGSAALPCCKTPQVPTAGSQTGPVEPLLVLCTFNKATDMTCVSLQPSKQRDVLVA